MSGKSKLLSFITASLIGGAGALALTYFVSCGNENAKQEEGDPQGSLSCYFEDSTVHENNVDNYMLSWKGTASTYKVEVTSMKDGNVHTRTVRKTSYAVSAATTGEYKIVIRDGNDSSQGQTIYLTIENAIDNSLINADYDCDGSGNVILSYASKNANAVSYYTIGSNSYKSEDGTLRVSSYDIYYEDVSVNERYEDETNGFTHFHLTKPSDALMIETNEAAELTFQACDAENYALKCDKNNSYASFDISFIQEGKVIKEDKGVLKSKLLSGGYSIPSSLLSEKDLTIETVNYGERSSSSLVATTKTSKTYKYQDPLSIDVSNGKVVFGSDDSVNGYMVSVTSYTNNKTITSECYTNSYSGISYGDYYKVEMLPNVHEATFTKTVDTGWFRLCSKAPSVTLSDADSLQFLIQNNLSSDSLATLSMSISHNGKETFLDSDLPSTCLYSLTENGKYDFDDPGEYIFRVYNVPTYTGGTFDDGEKYTIYNSVVTEKKIVKSEAPVVTSVKSEDGHSVTLSIDGMNDYYISAGSLINNQKFAVKNGVSSYTITNDGMNFDYSSKTVTVTAKDKVSGADVIIPTEVTVTENLKILQEPTDTLAMAVEDEKYHDIYFTGKTAGNYDFSLYYEDSSKKQTFIGTIHVSDGYDVYFENFFGENTYPSAGSYIIKVEASSSDTYSLNSKPVSTTVVKLAAPTEIGGESSASRIYWSADDVDGYRVTLNGAEVQDSDINNYVIDEKNLPEGANTLEIVAYAGGMAIWSNPLTIRLYKMESAALSISDSVLSYSNKVDGIKLSSTNRIYDHATGVELSSYITYGSGIDLKSLTRADYFSQDEDVVYDIKVNLTGTSTYYNYIYASETAISFTKLGTPQIDDSKSPLTEMNGRIFKMQIDASGYIYGNGTGDRTPAMVTDDEAHVYRFYCPGDGVTTIDSNITEIKTTK